jgi:hypothetical protein
MKTFFVIAAIVVSFFASVPAFASAVLLDAQGEVSVILPTRRVEAAKTGMELPDGSLVEVRRGTASLLLESGIVDELPAKTTYTVGAASAKGKRTNLGSGITLAMRELSSSGDGATVHGMVKEAAGPRNIQLRATADQSGLRGISPVGTSVRLGRSMTFVWSKELDFPNPLLVIDDARGKRLVTANLDAKTVEFTQDACKLHLRKGESYTWFLAAKAGSGVKGKTPRFKFATFSAADEQSLSSELSRIQAMKLGTSGEKLLQAQVYFQHGLYDEMVNELAPLYATTQAPFAKKLLKLGYLKMGNAAEAEKYR